MRIMIVDRCIVIVNLPIRTSGAEFLGATSGIGGQIRTLRGPISSVAGWRDRQKGVGRGDGSRRFDVGIRAEVLLFRRQIVYGS